MVAEMTGPDLELTTARFSLRPLTKADAGALHEIWTSAGVRRFLWDDRRISIERTTDTIEESGRLFRERRYGLWGAWSLDVSTLEGFAGLWPFREPPVVELVYGLAERRWGGGCATEIAGAVVAYCFEQLDSTVIRASTDPANLASIRVLEKLGFKLVDQRTVDGLPTAFYTLSRRSGHSEASSP